MIGPSVDFDSIQYGPVALKLHTNVVSLWTLNATQHINFVLFSLGTDTCSSIPGRFENAITQVHLIKLMNFANNTAGQPAGVPQLRAVADARPQRRALGLAAGKLKTFNFKAFI